MLSNPASRAVAYSAARATMLMYVALATPVVVILALTALLRDDGGLAIAAAALLGASIVAGALAAVLVHELNPPARSGPSATFLWIVALAAPVYVVWTVARLVPGLWLRSTALRDALIDPGEALFLLALGVTVTALLLAAGMMVSTSKPVLLRHRQGPFTDRTILAIAAVLLVAVIANLVTRPERIGDESTAALQLQLPRLQRESERYPTHFATQYRYGNALTRQRDCASAVAPLERAVALNSDDGWAQNDLAYALTCARRYAAAIAPGREAIRLLPTERRPYYNLAWALEQSHDEQGAGEVYRQLLLHWPNEAVAMARAAFIHYRGGARKEGLAELQRALAIDDSSYWMLITAAELYSSAARLDDALNQYRALATRDSTNLWAWGQYGSTAYLAGRLDEARRAFDHVEKIAPHIFDSESPWRAMRDAARQNIPPSKLPPIPPFQRSDAMLIQLPSTR